MTIHRRVATATAVAVAGLLGLTGCGSDLGPDLHPGTAAEVGNTRISISEVDEKALDLCAFASESGQLTEPLTMSTVRVSYLQTFINYHLAKDYLAEQGVADDPALVQQLASDRATIKAEAQQQAPEELRDIYVEMTTMQTYLETASQIGGEDFARWITAAQTDVVRDPRFPTLDAEGRSSRSGDLSVPVSDLALFAAEPQSQQEFDAHLASLPDSQKCSPPQA